MKRMTLDETKTIEQKITEVMAKSVNKNYAEDILAHYDSATGNSLMEDIITNIMLLLVLKGTEHYDEEDIKLAIGKELAARLEINYK